MVACQKDTPSATQQSHSIHVGFSTNAATYSGITNKLVVTESSTGKYLASFEIPHGVYDFEAQLDIEGASLSNFLDYHLIKVSGTDYPYLVYSQVGVLSGTFVYFQPHESNRFLSNPILLNISGIEAFDSVATLTWFLKPRNVMHDQNEKTLSMEIPTLSRTGNILRLRANGATDFRYYYLPDSLHGDTLSLTWDALMPESNLTQVVVEGNPYISTFEIDAVSPDFKNTIAVFRALYTSTLPSFNLPEILPDNWSLRVKLNTSKFFSERIFGMQETIEIEPPNMSLDKLEFSNNEIIVHTSGEVDEVRCSSLDGDFYWEIKGPKVAFEKVVLPNLSPFLPASVKQSSIKGFIAEARQYGGHNALEIQEGFPFRNTGLFPVARSGFYSIQQSF